MELLYELIDEKDAEAKALKNEIKELQECCDEIHNNLEEAQTIIAEQQEQLDIYRQEVAISKSNIEALKVSWFLLPSKDCQCSVQLCLNSYALSLSMTGANNVLAALHIIARANDCKTVY